MKSLSDIVAEMRTRSREIKEAFGGRPDGVENMLDIWAGRIEAAAKRVVVSKTETTTVGNAAAMREALIIAKKAICHHAEHICQSLSWEDSNQQSNCADVLCAHRELCKAKTAINAALSAPARQCDVGTAEEQTKRFSDFCAAHRHTDLPRCAGCPLENTPSGTGCSFAYEQMPYAAKEGGAAC